MNPCMSRHAAWVTPITFAGTPTSDAYPPPTLTPPVPPLERSSRANMVEMNVTITWTGWDGALHLLP